MRILASLVASAFLTHSIAGIAQESRSSVLMFLEESILQRDWVYIDSPPQSLKMKVLEDDLFENSEPLFSADDFPSFEYTFVFQNEIKKIYKVVFYKSAIDEKCGGYDSNARFYSYRETAEGFERTPNNGENGFSSRNGCVH